MLSNMESERWTRWAELGKQKKWSHLTLSLCCNQRIITTRFLRSLNDLSLDHWYIVIVRFQASQTSVPESMGEASHEKALKVRPSHRKKSSHTEERGNQKWDYLPEQTHRRERGHVTPWVTDVSRCHNQPKKKKSATQGTRRKPRVRTYPGWKESVRNSFQKKQLQQSKPNQPINQKKNKNKTMELDHFFGWREGKGDKIFPVFMRNVAFLTWSREHGFMLKRRKTKEKNSIAAMTKRGRILDIWYVDAQKK